MKIKVTVLKKIRESAGCKREIMKASKMSPSTLSRHLKANSDALTSLLIIEAIGKYFNLGQDEIVDRRRAA